MCHAPTEFCIMLVLFVVAAFCGAIFTGDDSTKHAKMQSLFTGMVVSLALVAMFVHFMKTHSLFAGHI